MSDAVLITLILAFSVTTVASPFLSWWDRSSLLRALDNGDIPRVRIAGRVLVDRHDLDTLIDTAKATA